MQKALPEGSKHTVAKLRRKAFFSERSIRKIRNKIDKIKTFTGRNDVWPKFRTEILESLNNKPLANLKIDIAPNDVTLSNSGQLFNAKFSDYLAAVENQTQSPLFPIGEPVRITLLTGPFTKGINIMIIL